MANRAKVLCLDQTGALGGAELCLLDELRVRRQQGVPTDEVVLFADGPFAERLRAAGLPVRVMPLGAEVAKDAGLLGQLAAGPRALSLALRLARLARGFDVVYANTQKAAVLGAAAAWLAGKPLVWRLHDILDAAHFSTANRRAVIAATNRVARAVIANSRATADAYRRAGGRAAVSVVYNGIDPALFDAAIAEPIGPTRAELGVPEGALLVGLFGRLTSWKGQHVLVEALGRPECQSVHALFVGDALFTAEDRAYSERLRRLTAEPLYAGRFHWLGHREEVPRLMRACDAVVHASVAPEPFGRVVVEGQLAGRPVLASNAGGAAEIVVDGETGLLVEPGNAATLAAAIGRVLGEPELASRLAAAGRREALRRFDLATTVEQVSGVLEGA